MNSPTTRAVLGLTISNPTGSGPSWI